MSSEGGRELRRLAVLRGVRKRLGKWRRKKRFRPPGGTLGHAAKEHDREFRHGDEPKSQQ